MEQLLATLPFAVMCYQKVAAKNGIIIPHRISANTINLPFYWGEDVHDNMPLSSGIMLCDNFRQKLIFHFDNKYA